MKKSGSGAPFTPPRRRYSTKHLAARKAADHGNGARMKSPTGNASSRSSIRVNRTDTSAYTIGLITRGPVSPARSSAWADHCCHCGSFVIRSSRTFESTRVAAAEPDSVTAGQRHDLGRAHRHVPATTKVVHDAATTAGRVRGPFDQHGVAVDDKLDLVARSQS